MAVAQRLFKKAAPAAGVPKADGPPTLRHAFATHLLAGGTDIRTLQELPGQRDVRSP